MKAEVRVRLQPRARGNEIVGEREGALLVRVTAPPLEGRANEALRKLIARRLRIGVGHVRVVRGESSRDKLVAVEGMAEPELRRALGLS